MGNKLGQGGSRIILAYKTQDNEGFSSTVALTASVFLNTLLNGEGTGNEKTRGGEGRRELNFSYGTCLQILPLCMIKRLKDFSFSESMRRSQLHVWQEKSNLSHARK